MARTETSWRPGTSGNPAGRPKKERALTHILEQRCDREKLVDALLDLAYSGDLPALMYVFLRLDGAPEAACDVRERWDLFEEAVMHVVVHLANITPGCTAPHDDPMPGVDQSLFLLNGGSPDVWQTAAARLAAFIAERQAAARITTNGHTREPIPALESSRER